jgi:hypothetical protein
MGLKCNCSLGLFDILLFLQSRFYKEKPDREIVYLEKIY